MRKTANTWKLLPISTSWQDNCIFLLSTANSTVRVLQPTYDPIKEDRMNKADLMNRLKRQTGLKKHKAQQVVDTFFEAMSNALVEDGRVEIRGFCSFYVKDYKPYVGRNPKTGQRVQIAPKRLPFFKCGKELKERVDQYSQ